MTGQLEIGGDAKCKRGSLTYGRARHRPGVASPLRFAARTTFSSEIEIRKGARGERHGPDIPTGSSSHEGAPRTIFGGAVLSGGGLPTTTIAITTTEWTAFSRPKHRIAVLFCVSGRHRALCQDDRASGVAMAPTGVVKWCREVAWAPRTDQPHESAIPFFSRAGYKVKGPRIGPRPLVPCFGEGDHELEPCVVSRLRGNVLDTRVPVLARR